MKKTRTAKKAPQPDKDMLPEYRFDYSKRDRKSLAGRVKPGSRAVVLDPDVAEVFATPESVNAVLQPDRTMSRKFAFDGEAQNQRPKLTWPAIIRL